MTKNFSEQIQHQAWLLWKQINELQEKIWNEYYEYFIDKIILDDIPTINPNNDSFYNT